MKRPGSRASKMSTDAQDLVESFPGIPDGKWQEFLEREETEMFILGVREEIVDNCLRICYEKYMEKQAVAFTVHCAYLAWVKVLDVYSMCKDPGDTEDPKVRATWEPDEEPETSVIDSWASECIKMTAPPPGEIKEKKKEKSMSESEPFRVDSLETSSFMSGLFDEGEGEYYYFLDGQSDSNSTTRRKSIFTRTLSMSRESLPLLEPLILFHGGCKPPEKSSTQPSKR